jgi:hypothetical protein
MDYLVAGDNGSSLGLGLLSLSDSDAGLMTQLGASRRVTTKKLPEALTAAFCRN